MSTMPPAKAPEELGIDFDVIRMEPWLAGLIETLNEPKFKLDGSVVNEMHDMIHHHTKAFKDGKPRLPIIQSRQDLLKLQYENALCLANRDRVVEILMKYAGIRYAYDELWSLAEARILESPAFYRMKNEMARKAFILGALEPIHKQRNRVKKAIEIAEILREHLSHTHFTIKQHVEMGVAFLNEKSA